MKETKNLYSSVGWLIGLNLVIKPLWIFGIDRQVQNIVGTETYGLYFSLLSFSIVFSFLLDWGLASFFNRQLAADPHRYNSRTGAFLKLKLFFCILYAAVVCIAAFLSGIRNWDILIPVVAIQVLTSLFVFFRSIVTGRQWFRTDAWFSVLDKTLMILVCGSFLYFPAFGKSLSLLPFLYVQVICTSVSVIAVVVLLWQQGIRFPWAAREQIDSSLLKQALPYATVVLLMSVHSRLDGFMLERLHPNGAYEAGIYAGAYRLLDAANMAGFLLATFLLPFIARHWNDKPLVNAVVRNSRHLLLLMAVYTGITVYFLAPWIQDLLYRNQDENAITVLQWCLPVLAAYSLLQVYGTVMTAGGQVTRLCYIVFGAVCINISLNLLLIPGWGAQGACIAALVSQGACALATLLHVHVKSGINLHARSLLMYIFIAAALAGFYYGCRAMTLSPWLQVAIAAAGVLGSAFLLQLTRIRQWRGLLKI